MSSTEWAVKHNQGIAVYESERQAREALESHRASYERNFRNKFEPYVVSREVTDWERCNS